MPRLAPFIPSPQLTHELDEWQAYEAAKYFVQMRRRHCSFMETLSIRQSFPLCSACAVSRGMAGSPHISGSGWEVDVLLELGEAELEGAIRRSEANGYTWRCHDCHDVLNPSEGDDVIVDCSDLEEAYEGLTIGHATPSVPRVRRQLVLRLYDFRCFGCNKAESSESRLTIDHIIPRVAGGSGNLSNLQPLCSGCAQIKGAVVPVEIVVHDTMHFSEPPSDGYEGLFWA